jgi:hypothetical protein
MRIALSLLLVMLTSLACVACGNSGRAFSVREVERVFAEHGLPFASEIRPAAKNPYLQPSQPSDILRFPPSKERKLEAHLRAVLGTTNPRTFAMRMVYVFDSSASLQLARKLVPGMFKDRKGSRTVQGNTTSESGCAMHRENVFTQASYGECSRVRAILADLH